MRNVVFTVNHYDAKLAKGQVLELYDEMKYLVVGFEEGEEKKTKHMQGYGILKKQMPFLQVKKLFDRIFVDCGTHLEVRRGTHDQAADYCKKDGDFLEYGEGPKAGKRNDIQEAVDTCKEGVTLSDLAWAHGPVYVKYHGGLTKLHATFRERKALEQMHSHMAQAVLRPWQRNVVDHLDELEELEDDRKIIWVADYDGNKGKTFLSKWLVCQRNAQIILGSTFPDMAYALDEEKDLVIIDIPYALEADKFPYSFMEKVRDGTVFSSKYESKCKVKASPWRVIVFSNRRPVYGKMAADRFVITELSAGAMVQIPSASPAGAGHPLSVMASAAVSVAPMRQNAYSNWELKESQEPEGSSQETIRVSMSGYESPEDESMHECMDCTEIVSASTIVEFIRDGNLVRICENCAN